MTDDELKALVARLRKWSGERLFESSRSAEAADAIEALVAERDGYKKDIGRLFIERETEKARADELRGVVQKCAEALGNGAFVGWEASDDFHALVPSEIGLHVASLVEDRDTWQERARDAEARAERAEAALREIEAHMLKGMSVVNHVLAQIEKEKR